MATKSVETRLVKVLLGNRTVEGGDGDRSKVQRMKHTPAQIFRDVRGTITYLPDHVPTQAPGQHAGGRLGGPGLAVAPLRGPYAHARGVYHGHSPQEGGHRWSQGKHGQVLHSVLQLNLQESLPVSGLLLTGSYAWISPCRRPVPDIDLTIDEND